MLIVGIPKSASTALLRTLGTLHKLPTEELHFPDLKKPEFVKALHHFHPDIVELDLTTSEQLGSPSKVHKQHLPPTENNVEMLKSQPVVVLLRELDQIVPAYHRGFKTRAMHSGDIESVGSLDDWLSWSEDSGLREDLESFAAGWLGAAHPNLLYVKYEELLSDPTSVINRIEEFWGWPKTAGPIKLSKARYTRSRTVNVRRVILHQARRFGLYESAVRIANRAGFSSIGQYDPPSSD